MQTAVSRMVGEHIMVLARLHVEPPGQRRGACLVRAIRSSHPSVDGEVLVTGPTAFDLDFMGVVQRNAPLAMPSWWWQPTRRSSFSWARCSCPSKLSSSTCCPSAPPTGALVWIFQDGHLSRWLDFTPGPIQTATPIIMFSA